jgi:hypothetical protein
MLLTLMLFVTLLAIASMSWIESVDFQIKRDLEEELIHRGVGYSPSIRRYVVMPVTWHPRTGPGRELMTAAFQFSA